MKNLLMNNNNEPSDLELSSLMIEVAKDAMDKALIEKKRLKETISNYILVFNTKMNSN
jgi:hypothetical protein